MESSSFMFKHWSIKHKDVHAPPTFQFKVLKCHKDPLTRVVHESISIVNSASINSKSEVKGYKIARITIEKRYCESKCGLKQSESVARQVDSNMQSLRDKAQLSTCQDSNLSYSCRKRRKCPALQVLDRSFQ